MALKNDDFLDELLKGSETQKRTSDKNSHEVDDILNFATRKKLENAMDKDVDRILNEDVPLSKAKKYSSPEKTQSFKIPDKPKQKNPPAENTAGKTIMFDTSKFDDIKKLDFEEPVLFEDDDSDFDGSDEIIEIMQENARKSENDTNATMQFKFSDIEPKTRKFNTAVLATQMFSKSEVKKAADNPKPADAKTMQFSVPEEAAKTQQFEAVTNKTHTFEPVKSPSQSDSNKKTQPINLNPAPKPENPVNPPNPPETDASYKKQSRHVKADDYGYDADVEEMNSNPQEKKKLPIAAAIAALVGIAALGFLIMFCISNGNAKNQNSSDSEAAVIEKAVFPAVAADLGAFSTPEEIPNDTLIVSAIFNMISNLDLSQNYTVTDGYVTIPQADIEYYAENLYGADLSLENHAVDYYSLKISYDEAAESYTFEANPPFYSYVPKIENIVHEDGIIKAEVSYLVQTPAWAEYAETYNSDMYLYAKAEYTLQEKDGSYVIKSVSAI